MRLDQVSDPALLREEIRLLRDRVEFLEEENRQLRATHLTRDWEPPLELGLTPNEKIIFAGLFNQKGTCSKPFLMDLIYALRPGEAAEEKIIDVCICRMRKKIAEFELQIDTVWGQGYAMPEESKVILRNWGKEPEALEEAA